jgi:hypothetical protein
MIQFNTATPLLLSFSSYHLGYKANLGDEVHALLILLLSPSTVMVWWTRAENDLGTV